MNELKVCPKCSEGTKHLTVKIKPYDGSSITAGDSYRIECGFCGHGGLWQNSPTQAICAWNDRPVEDGLRKQIANLIDDNKGLRIALLIDEEIKEDAKRMRWLLAGNGYFMEEQGLCGYKPCGRQEQNEARIEIDAARLR